MRNGICIMQQHFMRQWTRDWAVACLQRAGLTSRCRQCSRVKASASSQKGSAWVAARPALPDMARCGVRRPEGEKAMQTPSLGM